MKKYLEWTLIPIALLCLASMGFAFGYGKGKLEGISAQATKNYWELNRAALANSSTITFYTGDFQMKTTFIVRYAPQSY